MNSTSETRPADRLQELLAESSSAAAKRAAETFDQAASPYEKRIVIYGAGNLGRRTLRGLRANGLDALAFADRSAPSCGTSQEGLEVLPPEEAVRRYGDNAVFVVAVWNQVVPGGLHSILLQLREMGCLKVAPFVWLAWKYPEQMLPNYLWDLPQRVVESAEEVKDAFRLFKEEQSQAQFLSQLEFRLTGDFSRLCEPDVEIQYFPEPWLGRRSDEFFVDCGAYDGDTLRQLAEWTGGRFRGAVSVEADPASLGALQQMVATDERLRGRVRTVAAAVGRERGKLRFEASGLSSAAISSEGNIEVECLPLDEILGSETPTYIKMDIEGAELDALHGGAESIRRNQPVLAICCYHVQEHMWEIPQLIHRFCPDSDLRYRSYAVNGFELVCYAVPRGRMQA